MKIKQVTWQHRYDFYAIMECEHCNHTAELKTGYNDAYYHSRVIPAMRCKQCGLDRDGNKEHSDKGVTPETLQRAKENRDERSE